MRTRGMVMRIGRAGSTSWTKFHNNRKLIYPAAFFVLMAVLAIALAAVAMAAATTAG